MAWKFFAVKTAYRYCLTGRAKHKDENYDSTTALVEERIVLFKARSFKEAMKRGEAEAKEYCAEPFTSPYGQRVTIKYLGAVDVFEPFDDPASGVEVFSQTMLVQRALKDNELVDNLFGREEKGRGERVQFLNGEFLRPN